MGRRIITWALRKGKDDALAEALEGYTAKTGSDRSDVIRDALKAFLGLGGTRIPAATQKRDSGQIWAADSQFDAAPLVPIQKADVDIDAGLDNLLNAF